MKYIVAVSGGVDSVVLLDMLAKSGKHQLIVAHFDHGIREDSAADARFVEGLAQKYGLPYYSKREELSAGASEAVARTRRYAFLRNLAKKHGAKIVTAHHADDVVETIAINIIRGTGWRGVAVMGGAGILRPLAMFTKQAIYNYALEQRLEWVEDSTNSDRRYLRNRLRAKLSALSVADRERLLQLWKSQELLRRDIDSEVRRVVQKGDLYSRYYYIMVSENVAMELLGYNIVRDTGQGLLTAQLQRGVLAIKTARAGTVAQLGTGVELYFKTDSFIAKTGQKML